MIFYSYAELLIGLVAVSYFIYRIFEVQSCKLFLTVSFLVMISTPSLALFLSRDDYYGVTNIVHFLSLTFVPLTLKINRRSVALLVSLFFSGTVFFVSTIVPLLISLTVPFVSNKIDEMLRLIANLLVLGLFVLLASPLKSKTKLVINSISKTTILITLAFLYTGGILNLFGTYYIPPSSDYRTVTLKVLTLLISVIFSFSIPVLMYNQINKNRYMYESNVYENQLNAQINYYKSITSSGYELRKLRHDYNDLSLGIKSMLKRGEYNEIMPLLQKYDSEIIGSLQILYNTGNDLADAILTDKQKHIEKGISIHFEGSLMGVPTDSLEICVLMNNMLDIAISNTQFYCIAKESIVNFKAETRAGFLFLAVDFAVEPNEIKKAQNDIMHRNFAYKTLENLAEENGGKIGTSLSDDRLAIKIGWVL